MDTQTLSRIVTDRRDNAWNRFVFLYPGISKFARPHLTFSNRMTKTAGFCVVETGEIRLSNKYLIQHLDTMMREILPHEIAHYVDFLLHGMPINNRWHGPTWQKVMLKYGLAPETYHRMILK